MALTETLNYLLRRFDEKLFLTTADFAPVFGMTPGGVRNALLKKRFPCPTIKLGNARVIPIQVLADFIDLKTAECDASVANAGEVTEKRGRKTQKEKEQEAVLLASRKQDLRTNSAEQKRAKTLTRQAVRAAKNGGAL